MSFPHRIVEMRQRTVRGTRGVLDHIARDGACAKPLLKVFLTCRVVASSLSSRCTTEDEDVVIVCLVRGGCGRSDEGFVEF